MKSADPINKLIAMLEAFVAGGDQSTEFTDKIELLLSEGFYEDQELNGLLLALAAYTPQGGEYLYDRTTIIPVMKEAIYLLRERLKPQP